MSWKHLPVFYWYTSSISRSLPHSWLHIVPDKEIETLCIALYQLHNKVVLVVKSRPGSSSGLLLIRAVVHSARLFYAFQSVIWTVHLTILDYISSSGVKIKNFNFFKKIDKLTFFNENLFGSKIWKLFKNRNSQSFQVWKTIASKIQGVP